MSSHALGMKASRSETNSSRGLRPVNGEGDIIMRNLSEREMIGESAGFRKVLEQVNLVAPVDCAVLIEGETGTGKELIARAIHDRSRRSSGPFVKLNCAAIPAGLLESELFGHER